MDRNVIVTGNTVWLTYKFLENYNVPSRIIYKHTSKKNAKRWYVRCHPSSNKIKLIDYSSISIEIIKKYNLPEFSELKAISETESRLIRESYSNKASKIIKNILDIEYHNWELFRSIYNNLLFDDEKIEKYCKTHALFSKILELHNLESGFRLDDIFQVYCTYEGLIFETSNSNSFANKIRKIKQSRSIEDELIHGLRNRISNNHRVTEDIVIEILNQFKNPKKYSATLVTEKVNDYIIRTNRKPISQKTVEAIYANSKIKNEIAITRYGKWYVKEKMLPHEHFDPPHKEGLLWGMDGTRFQFAYKGGSDKYNFLTYYIIIDGYDKKIIGYSYDDGENTEMAINAFEQACRSKNYLPTEIITDNSPAYRSKEYSSMITAADRLGVKWRRILTKNARDNSYVERTFNTIQEKHCKKYDGYIGDGIKSKNPDGRPAPEEISNFLKNKKLRTRDGVIELINQIVHEYNNSKDRKNLMRKDEYVLKLFGKRNINPIYLDSSKYAKLFWNIKEIKLQFGMISFQLSNKDYYYNIYDSKIIKKHHGNIVKVRYNKLDLSKIMVFEHSTDNYICTLDLYDKIPKAYIERTDAQNIELFSHSQKVKKMEMDLLSTINQIDQKSKENWEKVPPELAEFTALSKPIREESEKEIVNKELEKYAVDEKIKLVKEKSFIHEEESYSIKFDEKGTLKKL